MREWVGERLITRMHGKRMHGRRERAWTRERLTGRWVGEGMGGRKTNYENAWGKDAWEAGWLDHGARVKLHVVSISGPGRSLCCFPNTPHPACPYAVPSVVNSSPSPGRLSPDAI